MTFAHGGYDAVVDGIVGPWFLPPFRAASERGELAMSYVVLRAGLDVAISRARGRRGAELSAGVSAQWVSRSPGTQLRAHHVRLAQVSGGRRDPRHEKRMGHLHHRDLGCRLGSSLDHLRAAASSSAPRLTQRWIGCGVLTDSVSASRVIVANQEEPAVNLLLVAWYWSRSWHRQGAWRGSECCRRAVVS